MENKITLLVITSCLLLSCKKEISTANTYDKIKNVEWFIGEWANSSAEGELTERWKKVNDSVFHGESYFVTRAKDTAFAETVVLAETNDVLSYTVTVPNQNEAKPVRFDATSVTGSQIVFENPKHDFPNKVVYNKVGSDSLTAEIFGLKKGKPSSEKFAMKKIN